MLSSVALYTALFFSLAFFNRVADRSIATAGLRKTRLLLASVGVVVHELSHLFFCILFGHKVSKVSLFSPKADGTLGFVEHSYNTGSMFQRFGTVFIALAPMLGAVFAVYVISILMWPAVDFSLLAEQVHVRLTQQGLVSTIDFVLHFNAEIHQYAFSVSAARYGLWLFLVLSILHHGFPSTADIQNMNSNILPFLMICAAIYLVFTPLVSSAVTTFFQGMASLLVMFWSLVVLMDLAIILAIFFIRRGFLSNV